MHGLRLQDRQIFPELNVIAANDLSVRVEPKVMDVLLELAKHPGEVVSRAQLIQSVWGGVFVCEDVVTNAVSLLRRALGDKTKNPSLIQTVPKRGYRLLSPIIPESIHGNFPKPPSADTFRDTSRLLDINSASDSGPLPSDLREAILRVRYLRQEETVPSLNSACAYCEEIIGQDPNCAAAHAELALTLFLLEKLGAVQRKYSEPKVRSAVDRALRLDERASMSLVCLAKQEYRYDWKWDKAEQHFQKAIESSPQEADAFTEFSIMLSVMRRFDEGLTHARRACMLDPLSPAARLQAGHANFISGRWALAAVHYRRLLRFTKQHLFARWGLGDALMRAGEPREAIAILREGLSMRGGDSHPLLLTALSRIQATVEAPRIKPLTRDEWERQTDDPVLLAELYGFIGETGKALKLLDEAADLRHYRLSAVNMFPQFEMVRADPRYSQLLKRIGLYG